LTISFYLYNTEDLASINDNFSFISLFYLQNLKTRTSWTTFLPPKVYSVDTMADGGIYMPMAYVENFDVKAIGQLRDFKEISGATFAALNSISNFVPGVGRLIPEAYLVTITLREALPESANIMAGALGGKKVTVISSGVGPSGAGQPGKVEENPLGSSPMEYAIDENASSLATAPATSFSEQRQAMATALNTAPPSNPLNMGTLARNLADGQDPIRDRALGRRSQAEDDAMKEFTKELPGGVIDQLGPRLSGTMRVGEELPKNVQEEVNKGSKVELTPNPDGTFKYTILPKSKQ
jgi:hypothetical protein